MKKRIKMFFESLFGKNRKKSKKNCSSNDCCHQKQCNCKGQCDCENGPFR